MGEREMWASVIAGQAEGVRRLFELEVLSAKEAVDECDRLLNHGKGCPTDVAHKLRELRSRASSQLQ